MTFISMGAGVDMMARGFSIQANRNVSYGAHADHLIDIYRPKNANNTPIIFFVHGGAWALGDKVNDGVITKVNRWCPAGAIVTSMNYRMQPPNVLDEVDDVLAALTFIHTNAASYGGDPSRILLMGHSAGAHLVTLASVIGAAPKIIGTVSLDSAAYNVNEIMNAPHEAFYDTIFGASNIFWTACSPYWRIQATPKPMLLVASSLRENAVAQANSFSTKIQTFVGDDVQVMSSARTHADIHGDLGKPNVYTTTIEAWMTSHNALD